MVVILAATGWVAGLLFAAYGAATGAQAIAGGAVVGLGTVVAWRSHSLSILALTGLVVVAAALGEWRFSAYDQAQRATEVAAYVERSDVDLRGVVADDPVEFGSGWEFPVDARRMELGGDWVPARGSVMVRGVATAPYRVGDLLDVDGVLLAPDPSLPAFLSPLRQAGIEAVGNRPVVTPMGGRESSLPIWLANRREDAALTLDRSLLEPEAGLARGITLGQRRALAPDLAADFQHTNTSHILAVDGLKMGYVGALVAGLLGVVLAPIPAAIGTILGMAAYAVFVGASPSAVRAAVMGALVAWGRAISRPADALNGLALATLGMTAVNPFLLGAVAFQLSVLTTAGLVLLVPIVDGWIPGAVLPRGHRAPLGFLREALVTTVAAEIASAPLVASTFSQISLVSLPVHLVVMPLLPLAIILSGLTIATGAIAPALGNLVGLFAWVPLAAIVGTVRWAGALPFAALALPSPGIGWDVLAYATLGLALLSHPNPFFGIGLPLGMAWARLTAIVPLRVLVPAIALPLALGVGFLLTQNHPVERVTFLSDGDAALIEVANGSRLYLQGNANATQTVRALGPSLPFWSHQVDLAILTVGNDDGLTDLGDLAGRLSFGRAIVPTSGYSDVARSRWQTVTAQRRLPVVPGQSGTTIRLGQATATIYALEGAPKTGRAAALDPSLAVLLTIGSARLLWVSAAPADQAALAASGIAPAASVLKLVGRGGSWGLDPAFVQSVNPSVVVLPSGAADRFAKPTSGTLDLLDGRQVYRTDLDGPVTIEVQKQGLVIQRGE